MNLYRVVHAKVYTSSCNDASVYLANIHLFYLLHSESTWATEISWHTATLSWGASHPGATHTTHHHGVEAARELKQLHLFLLHVLSNFGVLVNFVLEECCLELFLIQIVILEYPIVSDCADQHWHDHGVISHLL